MRSCSSLPVTARPRITRRRFTSGLSGLGATLLWPSPGVILAALDTAERSNRMSDASRELKAIALQLPAILRRHIDSGYAPGAVAVVAQEDRAEVVAVGDQAREGAAPMRADSVFRISSMTKPVTAAAAMLLVEDGRLRLHEPVDRWLPELARRRVLRDIGAELDDTVPAKRAITLEDLLTFRCGLGTLLTAPDTYPIQRRISELQLDGFGPPDPASPVPPDEWLRKLGTLPLMAQPGERWLYNIGSRVLGVLLARVSGTSLPDLLQKRIFEPLGMKDSGFFVPESKLNRLVSAYRLEAGRAQLDDAPATSAWRAAPAFPDGAAGLVSTADDYLAFSRFVLARGRVAGRHLLAEAAVNMMTTDHLTPAQRADGAPILGNGRGWGFGLSVVAQPAAAGLPQGSYGWNGGLGTTWLADPHSGRTAIVLTQTMFTSPAAPAVHQEVWRAVFAPALV
jgi:CubicO group peptidase (beta-lactamase class C family)